MGSSAGGIIFKDSKKSLKEISEFFFGKEFKQSGYCDSRKDDCAYIGKKENNILIVNTELADEYFSHNKIPQKVLDFIEDSSEVFAFQEYDSGASYGYSIFNNGELKRRILATDYDELKLETGEPLETEKQWLEGELINDVDENGRPDSEHKLLVNKVNQHQIPSVFKYKAILQLLMTEFYGLTCESMDDLFIESSHFKKELVATETPKPNLQEEMKILKPWWKIW